MSDTPHAILADMDGLAASLRSTAAAYADTWPVGALEVSMMVVRELDQLRSRVEFATAEMQRALSEAISRHPDDAVYDDLHNRFGHMLPRTPHPQPKEGATEK
jgi:hypothetical protein